MKRIAILASGNGSNAQRIIEYFRGHPGISVSLVMANNPDAYVITRARNLSVPSLLFTRQEMIRGTVIQALQNFDIDLIVLAGFLWLLPTPILQAYPDKIINIHPALLPKYGGKGMYGMHVHELVINAKEIESGISIHLVNERYDEGRILFQATCNISPEDTPETLAGKIHELEHKHYPLVIEKFLTGSLV
jgi:phosphoribosylglycinamide formyltransferase-1